MHIPEFPNLEIPPQADPLAHEFLENRLHDLMFQANEWHNTIVSHFTPLDRIYARAMDVGTWSVAQLQSELAQTMKENFEANTNVNMDALKRNFDSALHNAQNTPLFHLTDEQISRIQQWRRMMMKLSGVCDQRKSWHEISPKVDTVVGAYLKDFEKDRPKTWLTKQLMSLFATNHSD